MFGRCALTVVGRLMVGIVRVWLVVRVNVLFLQRGGRRRRWWRWRRRRRWRSLCSLHPRRQEWNWDPGGDGWRNARLTS